MAPLVRDDFNASCLGDGRSRSVCRNRELKAEVLRASDLRSHTGDVFGSVRVHYSSLATFDFESN